MEGPNGGSSDGVKLEVSGTRLKLESINATKLLRLTRDLLSVEDPIPSPPQAPLHDLLLLSVRLEP